MGRGGWSRFPWEPLLLAANILGTQRWKGVSGNVTVIKYMYFILYKNKISKKKKKKLKDYPILPFIIKY